MTSDSKTFVFYEIKKNEVKIKGFGIKRIGLFGSFVRKESNEKSDLDFLIEFETGKKTFNNFIQLNFFLEDLFKKDVDLVTVESLSPYIGPHILKEVEYVALTS